ncbi:MAG: HNH endonuclease [Planctomycetaceae bacterium]|nr:HNH endonuclease [Planctomycetaceae bacterium]
MSEHIPLAIRREIREHYFQCCAYCQSSEALTVVTFEVEHIVPRSHGGQTEFNNLCLACPSCNRHKSNRLTGIVDGDLVAPLFHPQQQKWLDHFDWSINATVIVGLTEVGIATINQLHMNRRQLVEVRALWVTLGKHPPN